MPKLALLLDASSPAPADATPVYWAARNIPAGALSLDAMLDEKLIDIRREHMNWAYETGFLPAGDGDLASALAGGVAPSMWWTSLLYERHPKLSPFLYPLYKLRRLEIALQESGCDELIVRGNDPVLIKILAKLCDSLSIKFSFEKSGSKLKSPKTLKEKIYFLFPAPLRALVRYVVWRWTIKSKLPYPDATGWPKTPDGEETATIAAYFPNLDLLAASRGRFRSRYWEKLHDLLNAGANKERPEGPRFVRWLLIRFPTPELSFDQCLSLRDRFRREGKDGLSYNYLEEFLTARDILGAFKRYAAIALQSVKLRKIFAANCHFKESRLNFWPLAREQWAESFAGWRSLERCLQNSAFKNFVKLAGPQRWTLFPLENCPWERMLTQAVRENGDSRPVYGAQHSIVRRTDFRYFDAPETFSKPECDIFQPDLICGNGDNAISQWIGNGMPEKRTKRLEALRYLYLCPDKAKADSLPPAPGEPLEFVDERSLLVLTSFFGDETKAHLDLLGAALDAGILDKWRILIKPHPYYSVDAWIEQRPEKRRLRVLAGPLSEIMKTGLMVWTSNSTTAALEATIKKLPVMVMAPENDFDLCPIQNIPGLPRTATVADVEQALKNRSVVDLPPGYLDLDKNLKAWSALLGLPDK
ncbi:MAG: hypothetical protein K2H64_00575 [Desulfovibrio sp.]|nr:hypothetical protein [Desulfovibrio sp.]